MFLKDLPPIAERTGSNPTQLKFTYTMAVYDPSAKKPVFFVTLEQSIMGANFLCTLDMNGNHANLGADKRWSNENDFLKKATSLIKQKLHIEKINEVKH